MKHIFINYRRADAGGFARMIHDRLTRDFAGDCVFFDRESIKPGEEYPLRLRSAVAECLVFLVAIGPNWLDQIELRSNAADGERDFVLDEIDQVLNRTGQGKPNIIPVLMGGATVQHLKGPNIPAGLSFHNALMITEDNAAFDSNYRILRDRIASQLPESVIDSVYLLRKAARLEKILGTGAKVDEHALYSFKYATENDPRRELKEWLDAAQNIGPMLEYLSEKLGTDAHGLNALHRFAVALQVRHPLDEVKNELRKWLRTELSFKLADQAITEFRTTHPEPDPDCPPDDLYWLYIDTEVDESCKLQATLFSPGASKPTRLAASEPGQSLRRERMLYDVIAKAQERANVSKNKLVVELGVSPESLVERTKSSLMLCRQDPGAMPFKLRANHFIVWRLTHGRSKIKTRLRLKDLSEVAGLLNERLNRGGLKLRAVDADKIIAAGGPRSLIKTHLDVVCFGMTRLADVGADGRKSISAIYDLHIPFACFAPGNPESDLTDMLARLEADVSDCRGSRVFSKIFELQCDHALDHEKHPANGLAFIWDDPSRNPYPQAFQIRA